jgi:hypothetical protein
MTEKQPSLKEPTNTVIEDVEVSLPLNGPSSASTNLMEIDIVTSYEVNRDLAATGYCTQPMEQTTM